MVTGGSSSLDSYLGRGGVPASTTGHLRVAGNHAAFGEQSDVGDSVVVEPLDGRQVFSLDVLERSNARDNV